MFPEQGRDIPFTIENYAYLDSFGRETVTWLRTFQVGQRRRFDAYMVRDPERNLIIDYLGTHQPLAVDIHLSVAENGGLQLASARKDSMRVGSRSSSPCSFQDAPRSASGLTMRSVSDRG